MGLAHSWDSTKIFFFVHYLAKNYAESRLKLLFQKRVLQRFLLIFSSLAADASVRIYTAFRINPIDSATYHVDGE